MWYDMLSKHFSPHSLSLAHTIQLCVYRKIVELNNQHTKLSEIVVVFLWIFLHQKSMKFSWDKLLFFFSCFSPSAHKKEIFLLFFYFFFSRSQRQKHKTLNKEFMMEKWAKSLLPSKYFSKSRGIFFCLPQKAATNNTKKAAIFHRMTANLSHCRCLLCDIIFLSLPRRRQTKKNARVCEKKIIYFYSQN